MKTEDKLWTIEEAAEYLGVKVATIYKLRHFGRGPKGTKVGRSLRFYRSEIDRWAQARAS